MKWRLEIRDLNRLTPTTRRLYSELVLSYGGVLQDDEDGGAFASYRTAEVCARNLYCRLGIRTQAIPSHLDRPDAGLVRSV